MRHAERLYDSEDPPLSAAGEARARALADVLRDAGIRAIYVSEYVRTKKTAEPLARLLGIKPRTVRKGEHEALLQRMRREHAGEVVLIVGHSDTLPLLIEGLGHAGAVTIQKDDYDDLFVLVPAPAAPPLLMRLHLYPARPHF